MDILFNVIKDMRQLKIMLLTILVLIMMLSISGCRTRTSDSYGKAARLEASEQLNSVMSAFNGEQETDISTADNDTKKNTQNADATKKRSDDTESNSSDKNEQQSQDRSSEHKKSGKSDDNDGKGNEADNDNNAGGDDGENGKHETYAEDDAYVKYNTEYNRTIGKVQPCQRYKVYIEDDSGSVAPGSSKGNVCLSAGLNNVDSINECSGIVVKYVSGDLLGRGITNTTAAENHARNCIAKYAENGVAVESVVLVSDQLLGSKNGRMVTSYYLAAAVYPEIMDKFDADEARNALLGKGYEGIYVYRW